MARTLVFSCIVSFSLGSALSAQDLSGAVNPNPAEPGRQIVLTVVEARGASVVFLDGCLIKRVTSGSPEGPIVWTPSACTDQIITLGPGQARREAWLPLDQDGVPLPAGAYWLQVEYLRDGLQPLRVQSFPFNVARDDGEARLTALTPAALGQSLILQLSAPGMESAAYVAAASFTSNVGFSLGSALHAALDMDALFALSFPEPEPSLFRGFQGELAADGDVAHLAIAIPALDQLHNVGFHVQALVFDPAEPDTLRLTNPMSFIIR